MIESLHRGTISAETDGVSKRNSAYRSSPTGTAINAASSPTRTRASPKHTNPFKQEYSAGISF